MKKFFAAILFVVMFIPAVVLAKPVTVLSMGFDKAGDEAKAVERMCMAAAGHSLAFIIPPDPTPESDFSKIVKGHYKEVTSNANIAAKRKDGNAIIVTGEVTVDFDKLRQIVRSQIKGLQEANTDDRTAFFVRITGINNPSLKSRAYGDVLQTYQYVFENLGFKNTDEDVVNIVNGGPADESFIDYCKRVNDVVENDGTIGYAVIGEIALEKLSEGATGIMWGSTARLQARRYDSKPSGDGLTGVLIFQFDDDYKLKGKDDNVAFFALRKAAMNSSRALAEHTLDYWKNHH